MQKDTRRQETVIENKESGKGGRSPQLAVYLIFLCVFFFVFYLNIAC